MALTMSYNEIKESLVVSAENTLGDERLSEVKNDFVDTVNSNRRFSCIKNYRELIKILEKRGLIGERSITALFRISERINDADLQRQMLQYENSLIAGMQELEYNQPSLPVNQYDSRSSWKFVRGKPRTTMLVVAFLFCCCILLWNVLSLSRGPPPYASDRTTRRPLDIATARQNAPSLYSDLMGLSSPGSRTTSNFDVRDELGLPEDVIEVICRSIGKSWMDLARKLKVREADIDDINEKHSSNSREKTREVLKIFQKGMDPRKWQIVLLDGLVQARRSDVKEEVEELIARHKL